MVEPKAAFIFYMDVVSNRQSYILSEPSQKVHGSEEFTRKLKFIRILGCCVMSAMRFHNYSIVAV